MNITYRTARKTDARFLAELDGIASGGVADFLYRGLVPGKDPVDLAAAVLAVENESYSYSNALVAEAGGAIAGMMISYHSRHHGLTDDIKQFFPEERLDRVRCIFTAPLPESLYIDAIAVHARFRNIGIGSALLTRAAEKARGMGIGKMSLIVFVDNTAARHLYEKHGFRAAAELPIEYHELIPHRGGLLVMHADA